MEQSGFHIGECLSTIRADTPHMEECTSSVVHMECNGGQIYELLDFVRKDWTKSIPERLVANAHKHRFKPTAHPRLTTAVKGCLDKLFDDYCCSSFKPETKDGAHLLKILVDLMNYEDAELCMSAAQVLYAITCKHSLLLGFVGDVYLVSPAMTPFLKKILPLASRSEALNSLLHGEVNSHRNPHLVDTLEFLSQSCVCQYDEDEPAVCEQKILYSSGERVTV